MNVKIGDKIRIIYMDGEPQYTGEEGYVTHIDDAGQIQMTWDDGRTLALIESEDAFEIIEKPKDNIDMEVKI